MRKKLLLLITAVLLSMASAFAQGGTTGPLTWELNNGTLTISGNGEMMPYLASGFNTLQKVKSEFVRK